MAELTTDEPSEFIQSTLKESTQHMQELIEMGSEVHKEAFGLLSSHAQETVAETKS